MSEETKPTRGGEGTKSPTSNGRSDVLTHRIVVCSLGATVILTALAITALAFVGQEVPPALPALGGTALGALAMLTAIMRRE